MRPATGCGRILAYVNEGGERKRLDLNAVLLFVHESVQVLVDRVLWVGESHGREIRGRGCLERRRDGDVVQEVRKGTARRHAKLCISVVLSEIACTSGGRRVGGRRVGGRSRLKEGLCDLRRTGRVFL